MRVLHVIPSVAPQYGGPSTAIVAMCEALNRIPGITAEVASTDAAGNTGPFDAANWAAKSTKLHLFPRGFSERWKWSKRLLSWLHDHAKEYDLIHTHAAWCHPIFAACSVARKTGIPVVYRPCGTLSRYTWTRGKALKWAYWSLFERRNVRSVAAFHCTSDEEAAELRDYRSITAPVSVIPLGVDDAAWSVARDEQRLRSVCGLTSQNTPIVLFLSRLHPKKGIVDLLLPAFARLKSPAILAIAGGVDEYTPNYPAEIQAAAEKLGIADRVRMLGSISASDRWQILDGASLFVLPSHQENFGIVVAEAMARAVPVVISDQVQIAPQLLKANAGVVVPLDPGALAEQMDRLLANDAERHTLGKSGQAYAKATFDWNAVAQSIADLYTRVLADRKKGKP